MPGNGSSPRDMRFGVFEVDVHAHELRKKGSRVKLQQQPFELLLILLDRPGAVVTREDLRQRLWPANVYVDFDRSLNKAMVKLREALGDSSDCPLYIETLPRIGYRFIGRFDGTPTASLPTNPAQPGIEVEQGVAVQVGNGSRRFLWIGVTALLLIGWPWYKRALQRFESRDARPVAIRSLAVLPLVNLSGDPDQDYFADGMTEVLTTDLGKFSALRVISRTSATQYKDTKKPLSEIARELNVDALVEGTVARSGSHLRITASLVQASPEKHIWAESYESEVGDALGVQGKIAQAVAREIQIKLTQKEQTLLAPVRTVNPEAQDLYLRGLYIFAAGGTTESSEKAIKYFQQSVEKDPNYARAYVGLAQGYATWVPGMSRPRDLMPNAKGFALKALSLDDTLASAHSTLGTIALLYDWDWSAAEQEFKRTIELNPNSVWPHEWHSRVLVTSGRTEEAIAEAKLSIGLDPSPLSGDYPIWVFLLARRCDLALERAQSLVDLAPNYAWVHFDLGLIYEQMGRAEDAVQEFLKAELLFGTDPRRIAQLKEAFAKSGARGYWKRTLENYKESAKSQYVPSVMVAEACVRVGDKECAFQWLEKGFQERDDLMINLKVEPIFDAIRSDPRYEDLVHRVGIPQ